MYSEVIPIETMPCSCWLIEFTTGEQHVTCWYRDATIDEVVGFVNVHRPSAKFTVQRVDVGEWVIVSKTKLGYSGDSRKVNQDLEVIV